MKKDTNIFTMEIKEKFKVISHKVLSIIQRPFGYYTLICLFLFIIFLIIDISIKREDKFFEDIWVNIHASVIEVFLLGLFIYYFNKLIEKKSDIKRYLEEVDDYRGWDEKEASFRIAGIIRRLNSLKIYRISLGYCFLKGAHLSRANLSKANLAEANLTEANLTDANLAGANLAGANLAGANLIGAKLMEANLIGADLTRANLTLADLTDANLTGVNLTLANLTDANLTDANLTDANLMVANLTMAKLIWAKLERAKLERAKLTVANLTETNLTEANLTEAKLTEANLTGVTLTGANLTGANLTGATLTMAKLTGAKLDRVLIESIVWFESLIERGCEGVEELKAKYYIAEVEEDNEKIFRIKLKEP